MSTPTPKKVLYIITKSNWGGAQRYVYDLATHLSPADWDVAVACGGTGELVTMLGSARIRTIPLATLANTLSPRRAWQMGYELYRLLRAERPDVVHLNSSVAGFVGVIAARSARVPRIIFTAHGWAFNEDRPRLQRLVFKAIHWLTVLLSHHTIAVSRAIITDMNWPWAASRMSVIHPGRTIGVMFDREAARGTLVDFHPPLAAYRYDPWIVCIAELHPVKQHHLLIEAMAKVVETHPTARLICIGDGTERARLTAKVALHSLGDHIFFTGAITEAARFLKAFDLFVLASRSEAYGYVLVEAGLAGVPVIASNVGGIPDIITDGFNGVLVTPSAENFAFAIDNALLSPNTTSMSTTQYQSNKDQDAWSLQTRCEEIVVLYINKGK